MARSSQACHCQTLCCLSRGGPKAWRVGMGPNFSRFWTSLQGEFRRHLETHSLDFKWIICLTIHPRCFVFFLKFCAQLFGWLPCERSIYKLKNWKTMKALCTPCFIERLHPKDKSGLTQSHSPNVSKQNSWSIVVCSWSWWIWHSNRQAFFLRPTGVRWWLPSLVRWAFASHGWR